MNKTDKLLELLNKKQLDGIYVSKQANVNYISNFPDEAAYVIMCKKGNYLITDGRFTELAEKVCTGFTVLQWPKGTSLYKFLANICKENNIKKLGFERNVITYGTYENLTLNLSEKNIELIPTDNLVESLRFIKNEEEIQILKKASEITAKAFEEILPYIKPGVTENQLTARLEFIIRSLGGDGVGFETILISGSKTSLPHGKPDNKVIEYGDFVTMDFGTLYKGYTSDMTRTIMVGKPSEKQLEVYNLVKEAQQKALDSIKAGVKATVPDDAVREILKPYIDYYYPGMGHGVGRELHEEPFLGNYGTRTIEENCVITVEPGIYIPNWGGVRIEDTILVKKDGIEILTNCSKELIILE